MPLEAVALNCSLKRSGGEPSSTDRMIGEVIAAMEKEGVLATGTFRIADYDIKPGVTSDEGDGDEWPTIRRAIVEADILIVGTPIWMGQPSSVAKRVMERLDAFIGETDDKGRSPAFGKVVVAAIVGNEDGAHHVTAELFQALNDVGFSVPAQGATYWVGEAMHGTDFKDLEKVPEVVASTTGMLARNAAHLAHLLQDNPFPGRD